MFTQDNKIVTIVPQFFDCVVIFDFGFFQFWNSKNPRFSAFEKVFWIKSTTGGFYERITWKELWFRVGVLPSMLWVCENHGDVWKLVLWFFWELLAKGLTYSIPLRHLSFQKNSIFLPNILTCFHDFYYEKTSSTVWWLCEFQQNDVNLSSSHKNLNPQFFPANWIPSQHWELHFIRKISLHTTNWQLLCFGLSIYKHKLPNNSIIVSELPLDSLKVPENLVGLNTLG
jgi:hypothetical protein